MLIKGKVLTVSMLFTFTINFRDIKGISELGHLRINDSSIEFLVRRSPYNS